MHEKKVYMKPEIETIDLEDVICTSITLDGKHDWGGESNEVLF